MIPIVPFLITEKMGEHDADTVLRELERLHHLLIFFLYYVIFFSRVRNHAPSARTSWGLGLTWPPFFVTEKMGEHDADTVLRELERLYH